MIGLVLAHYGVVCSCMEITEMKEWASTGFFLLVCAAMCMSAEADSAIRITGLSYDTKEKCFVITIKNEGSTDRVLIDKLDPVWGIVHIKATNSKGEAVELFQEGADWEARPPHLLVLKPNEQIVRKMTPTVNPPLGTLQVTATYRVSKDSFYILNYVKRTHTWRDADGYEVIRAEMLSVWVGSTSAKFEVEIPSSDAPPPNSRMVPKLGRPE